MSANPPTPMQAALAAAGALPQSTPTAAQASQVSTVSASGQSPVAPTEPTKAPLAAAKRVPAVAAKTAAKPAIKKVPSNEPSDGAKVGNKEIDVGQAVAQAAVGARVKVAPITNLPPQVTLHATPTASDGQEGEEEKDLPSTVKLEVFGSGCLECSHLVDDPELVVSSEVPPCHFKLGGSHCPARFVRITMIPEWRLFADRLKKASDAARAGNPKRYTKLMGELASRPEDFQSQVLTAIGLLPETV